MSRPAASHTYGAHCRLAPVARAARDEDIPPPVLAQFFYSSIIPIDDPFASGSLAGASDAKTAKGQLRPFSRGDNNALERAWLSLGSDHQRRNHSYARRNRSPSPSLARENSEKLNNIIGHMAARHHEKHGADNQNPLQGDVSRVPPPSTPAGATTPIAACCSELYQDVEDELRMAFCAAARRRQYRLSQDNVVQEVMMEFRRRYIRATSSLPDSTRPKTGAAGVLAGSLADTGATGADAGMSGRPFVRVGTPDPVLASVLPSPSRPQQGYEVPETPAPARCSMDGDDDAGRGGTKDPAQAAVGSGTEMQMDKRKADAERSSGADVAVGVSRLHMVSLPALQMKPIYWSPVNDIAVVMRATWFYRDTMLPVLPLVANQLEAGFQELRPWTETWNDELRCAVEVGPLGEEKVSHRLWPEDSQKGGKKEARRSPEARIPTDPYCAARCCRGEAAAEGTLESMGMNLSPTRAHDSKPNTQPPPRSFSNYHVIYRDKDLAFLLKPSLRPSGYYGRRPVSKIMKGITVGIPVVRGFDASAWERLHDRARGQEKSAGAGAGAGAGAMADETAADAASNECAACIADKERGQVTDLVLVIHGIGQKLAERVESFHFTHAINAFRRAVNIELGNPHVREVLREGQNGIMVLPVNWRHKLSFDDGGPMTEADKKTYTPDGFGLKDIQPPTIPAVRGLISDIMFDIPFYMSHHKPMMIRALVQEANRVYRLWCRNNPGFDTTGRVHLIGHSLGSAMAIDILSRQPNSVPRSPPVPVPVPAPATAPARANGAEHFDFDTVNLFLVGSPAGFFLLLERGLLMPRRGRLKPGADPTNTVAAKVVGEPGTFGCIAVDNIYNVLAKEDPIAYLLNGSIDPAYAASLKTAYVPSTSSSLLQTVGSAVRSIVPGTWSQPPLASASASASTSATASHAKPPPMDRLPSQLELEVHDFTREEVAERKAYLLNDNGQIDYYLHSAGGALEIQYLNMLSAHSCYWYHRDFIRLLCVEIGRRPGRAHTLPAMRAAKVRKTRLAASAMN